MYRALAAATLSSFEVLGESFSPDILEMERSSSGFSREEHRNENLFKYERAAVRAWGADERAPGMETNKFQDPSPDRVFLDALCLVPRLGFPHTLPSLHSRPSAGEWEGG